MRIEFRAPQSAMPKKDPENPCPCQFRLFQMKEKKGEMYWLVDVGEKVEKDQVICEPEVEKKTVEFLSPVDGVIAEICVQDEETFCAGDLLCYIETADATA